MGAMKNRMKEIEHAKANVKEDTVLGVKDYVENLMERDVFVYLYLCLF
jgi:hypothetical protein